MALAPCLGFKAGTSLNRPVLRHPDFQPNNILVSESKEIIGLIDWQHCSILPLCLAAGIPKHFQNYGDPESERLAEPQLDLPSNYDSLPEHEQAQIRETSRKRLVHFLYAALIRRLNEEHYDAIFNKSVILHQRLFKGAGTPWEGDSITFRADIIRAIQDWQSLLSADSIACENEACSKPPLAYPDSQIREALDIDLRQKEADAVMDQMQDVLGVDALGWVPNDDYDSVKKMAHEIKAKMLEAAETADDTIAVTEHFPFDDFDEDS
ncbi:hypothetical protein Plec18167_000538 [Paecilomyces lecythidis]|uniref:Aminoglycoside phosphotransferase domain-containing protein n=1 Tax=Paecilomyces lecythidis TaxID=3004212 RepID=A0ABR3YE89_9EURO